MLHRRLFFIFCFITLYAASQEQRLTLHIENDLDLEGTLLLPEKHSNVPLVLIIAGSGPTDRDGNQGEALKTDCYRLLAEELQKNGIASFRFDKRGIGQSRGMMNDEGSLTFQTFVNDTKSWISLLKKDSRFSHIIIAGHSEGSLVGMIAAKKKNVSAFISIAGAGRPIDLILKEQLGNFPSEVKSTLFGMIDQLKRGDTIANVPPIYNNLFRPSVQPFLISWMKYDPRKEIRKLKMPVFILQGSADLQVKEKDAFALHEAKPGSALKIIKNMNHTLKETEGMSIQDQRQTYSDPTIPLHKEFVIAVVSFVQGFATK
jgi:pimeloyl-ACP methyl ester carboxylesterase